MAEWDQHQDDESETSPTQDSHFELHPLEDSGEPKKPAPPSSEEKDRAYLKYNPFGADAEPPAENRSPEDASSEEAESLADLLDPIFVVEGIDDETETESLQIHPVDVHVPQEEEEPATRELAAVSVDIAGQQEESYTHAQASSRAAAEELPGEEWEEVFDEEALEEEEPAGGIPKLYLYGSIAAGVLCLVIFGGVFWKLKNKEEVPIVAQVPTTAKNPLPVVKLPRPNPPAPPVLETVPGKGWLAYSQEALVPLEMLSEAVAPYVPPGGFQFTNEPLPLEPALLTQAPVEPDGEIQPDIREYIGDPNPKQLARSQDETQYLFQNVILQHLNGSLFAGKVMKINSEGFLLLMAEGEIFLKKVEILQILPSNAKEDLQAYPSGYVELANGKRMWGKILSKKDGSVTLADEKSRIVLSPEDVKEVRVGPGYTVVE